MNLKAANLVAFLRCCFSGPYPVKGIVEIDVAWLKSELDESFKGLSFVLSGFTETVFTLYSRLYRSGAMVCMKA